MKKYFVSISLGFVILVLVGQLVITVHVNQNIEDKGGEVNFAKLNFFYETYDENRDQFRKLATSLQMRFRNVEMSKFIVKSKLDSDLSIDAVYIPAQNETEKLLIMSSGVHGPEGFTGSAVQQYFMDEVLSEKALQNMGVLLIHAINPYGFKYLRRFTENNIDLNRNFDINKNFFSRKNVGYTKLYYFLNPQQEGKTGYFKNGFFFTKAIYYILRYKMKALRQATVQGQYEFKNGIFYGGNDFESQKKWLERLILENANDYEYIFTIDLHTGLGERGKLHLLPGNIQDERIKTLIEKVFKGRTIDWPNRDNEFYNYTGGFRDYVGKLIPADKKYIQMGFEYGTLNSQTTVGAVRSLQNMILENQGFHHGFVNSKSERIVKKRFREMFFPSSEIWRSQIIKQTSEILLVLIDRYAELKS